MKPALIPYSVNAVLWSDGAAKERWLGLPPDDEDRLHEYTRLGLSRSDGDRQVVFLGDGGGQSASNRWIETRFLTKQNNEWYGYSYAWNDGETEGELVEAKGADREFTIKTSGRSEETELALPEPNGVHGLPQPGRQLRARLHRTADESGARLPALPWRSRCWRRRGAREPACGLRTARPVQQVRLGQRECARPVA